MTKINGAGKDARKDNNNFIAQREIWFKKKMILHANQGKA